MNTQNNVVVTRGEYVTCQLGKKEVDLVEVIAVNSDSILIRLQDQPITGRAVINPSNEDNAPVLFCTDFYRHAA